MKYYYSILKVCLWWSSRKPELCTIDFNFIIKIKNDIILRFRSHWRRGRYDQLNWSLLTFPMSMEGHHCFALKPSYPYKLTSNNKISYILHWRSEIRYWQWNGSLLFIFENKSIYDTINGHYWLEGFRSMTLYNFINIFCICVSKAEWRFPSGIINHQQMALSSQLEYKRLHPVNFFITKVN